MIPPNKDTDLKFYQVDGKIQQGAGALEHMTSDADLVVWVAGNQFFAMDDGDRRVPEGLSRRQRRADYVATGVDFDGNQGGGWSYNGKDYRCAPDVYASVNLGHLRQAQG